MKTRSLMMKKCRNLKNEIKTRWGDSINLLYCSHIINKSRRSIWKATLRRDAESRRQHRESVMNVLHHVHLTSSPLIFASPFSNPQSKWHGRKLTLKHSILMTLDLALKQRMARNKLVQCIDCVYIVLPQSFSLADLENHLPGAWPSNTEAPVQASAKAPD